MRMITDRTLADVLAGNAKGCYTCADLNRVEQAVQAICQQTGPLDIHLDLQTYTDWGSEKSWPTRQEMERYLHNVRRVAENLWVTEKLPESMENLDFDGANRIEKALEQAEHLISSVLQTIRMSGEIFAGEEKGI